MRNPVVIGERVYLRPFEVEDAKVLAEASHHETETFMDRGRHLESPVETEGWIRRLYDGTKEAKFAVCLIENDECIGLIGLEHIDLINRLGETGTSFHNPAYRGKGYGTEAKHLILEYAFHRLYLERITSFVFEPNTRSAAALAKQGYRAAGRLKYDEIKDGRFQDFLLFDLTREDWLSARERWQEENKRRNA
jgi:RimJ/RimL family protein N-acetyltransferase